MSQSFSKNLKKFGLLIAGASLVVYALVFMSIEDSYFGVVLESTSEPDWEKISPRYLVKNSIPISLIEDNGQNCLLYAQNLDKIVNHPYFVKGKEVASTLNYESENQTIMVPCDEIHGEKSRLEIWYVTEDSPSHAAKYQYFITTWSYESNNE
jgi:hypothetical protein